MEIGVNTEPMDENELLNFDNVNAQILGKMRSKKKKNSHKSSLNQSFNKLKMNLLTTKFTVGSILIKFYSILLTQQLISFSLCIIGKQFPIIFSFSSSQLTFLISFLLSVLLSFISFFWKRPYRKPPYNYTLLVIFTISYTYSIAYLCLQVEENTMMMALFTTFVIIAILLIYVSMNGDNFSIISAIFLVLVAGCFHYYFFKLYTQVMKIRIILSLCWLFMWGMYLIFWTWKIINKAYKLKKNDFVLASFRFYIVILFILSMVFAMKTQLKSLFYNLEIK